MSSPRPRTVVVLEPRDAVPDYIASLAIAARRRAPGRMVFVASPTVAGKCRACAGDAPDVLPYFRLLFRRGARNLGAYTLGWLRTVWLIWSLRPEIVHVQWLVRPALESVLLGWLARGFRFRIVYTAHNVLPHDSGEKARAVYRRFYAGCACIVVHTRAAMRRLLQVVPELKGESVAVIPHGNFDLLRVRPADRADAKRAMGLPPEAVVIACLGKLRPYKGIQHLIRAFRLQTFDRPAVLFIAGHADDEPYYRELRREVESLRDARLILRNRYLPDEEFQTALCAADIVALPHLEIDQSGILLYAMTFGKAIVASNLEGFAEVLAAGQAAVLFSTGNVAELGEALSLLAGDAALRERLGTRARKIAELDYGWDRIAERTLQLYEQVAAETRPGAQCAG